MGHVWLVGMMGVGKTTVGALVAERLTRPLVDTDALVMERTGRTIPELFAEGEPVFRAAERLVVAELATRDDCVVSAGGGAVLDDDNVEAMKTTGAVVLLDADVDTIIDRLGIASAEAADRPLATGPDDLARIAHSRRSRYHQVADHVIDTSGRAPEQVADEVVMWLST